MASDDHSGILWFLGCMIILTMSGVLLSIMVDKRHHSSRTTNGLQDKIEAASKRIDLLQSELESTLTRFDSAVATNQNVASKEKDNRKIVREHRNTIDELILRKAELTASIPEIEKEFDDYRKQYRTNTWRNAVGERIDHLFLKSGRQFESVTIKRVTPFGFEISHSSGLARVDYKDLNLKLQDRFQWNEEERQAILDKERENRKKQFRSRPVAPRKSIEKNMQPDDDGTEIDILRNQFRLMTARVSSLQRSYNEAASNSRYGASKSMPGSLRTWQEQASILQSQLTSASNQLSLITEQLRQLAPDDPLLKTN